MIDLYMMENIAKFIQKKTKIIFLGDINQLPPIELGSVIKEICKTANNTFSKVFSKKLLEITQQKIKENMLNTEYPLNDNIIFLKKKYRFDSNSGIGKISKKLEEKNYINISSIIKKKYSDITWKKLTKKKSYISTLQEIFKTYQNYFKVIQNEKNPKKIINFFNKYRILCTLLDGPFGTKIINTYIENNIILKKIQKKENSWYHGRPVIITQNNIPLNLFNGEIGICLFNKVHELKIFFLSHNNNIKIIDPILIINYEVAWSTTIHKAQGSEFLYVTLILPNYLSKILSKELIYTAITRTKKKIIIYYDINILKKIINFKNKRHSGINSNIKKNRKKSY